MIPVTSIRVSGSISSKALTAHSFSSIAHQAKTRKFSTKIAPSTCLSKNRNIQLDTVTKRNQSLFPVAVSCTNHILSSKPLNNIKSTRFVHNMAGSSLPGSHLNQMHGTTVLCVKKNGKVVLIADGQVTFGETRLKSNARKLRRLGTDGKIAAGFAGSTADALTLFERLEDKLQEYPGQLLRACIALAKSWRTDKYLRQLNAIMIVTNKDNLLTLSGSGDVLEHSDVVAIGSGGNYALAAAKALYDMPDLDAEQVAKKAMTIAADICIYTNHNFTVEILGGNDNAAQPAPLQASSPGPAEKQEEQPTTTESPAKEKEEDEVSS